MEWRALEEHFRIAATQDPGPFGENAFEWDYSRYARGLGLTAEPGAHDLPHRGCAVLALPAARWDVAEAKYRAWAEQRGWEVWRFGARPTVAVPDPVVYALGVRAAGADSLLFARAGRPVVPAMGRRPRSEGMSFPLTAGERWLLATDRVRRRMRTEIAMRGLVLFIEEAEWLTPAGLSVLLYLLDAHRAWRARMLSQPARVYVVLATPPEREGSILRMLERFGLTGHTPVARERRKDVKEGAAGAVLPALRDIEEEYLYGALAGAPVALAEADVKSVFGASAIDRCRAMAERGLLRVRVEAGQTCYLPNPALPPGLAAPAPRAMRAIAARYRQRARLGHEHLALARAALALELGDPLRAVAAVARMPHTAGAMLPLRLFEALDTTLERARPRLRADHASAWFSLAAHHRVHDHARDLANVITDRELRTWKEMLRVVQVLLCTGRTHLDTCLPPDFWPRLKSQHLAGPFMDATCVLGELFWRKRYLSDVEIRQRYEFACDCFARWDRPRSVWFERLERLTQLIMYRAALQLEIPSTILGQVDTQGGAPKVGTLRLFIRSHRVPAYVAAAPMFAEAGGCGRGPQRSFERRDWLVAGAFSATTGQLEDLAIVTVATTSYMVGPSKRLLMRTALDDLLLFLPRRGNPTDRHELGRFLQFTMGGRVGLMGANALSLQHGNDAPGRDATDEMFVADALVSSGDLAAAQDRLMAGLARRPRCPLVLSQLLQSHIVLSRKSLDVQRVAAAADLIERHRAVLTPELYEHLRAFLEGSRALLNRDMTAAHRQLYASADALKNTVLYTRSLRCEALQGSRGAAHLHRIAAEWSSGHGKTTVWKALRALCFESHWGATNPSLGVRASVSVDYVLPMIDAWAREERDRDEVLRVAVFLKEDVDSAFGPLGRSFVSLVAEWAPHYYEQLREAVLEGVGCMDAPAPEARALDVALRSIEDAWRASHAMNVADHRARIVISARRSKGRQARAAYRRWYDDATTYSQLWDSGGAPRGATTELVAYGNVGLVRARPVPTVLRVSFIPKGEGAFAVDVTAGGRPADLISGRAGSARSNGASPAFLGQSSAAGKVRSLIESAAKCGYPTLILGETGVGKDLVARCVHSASMCRGREMVIAECAGIAETLLEAELFGHERGAFTGAHASRPGVFERANGSSLMLDEVDSASARLQAVLLRALETGEYRPVGATSARQSQFRVIAAALPRLLTMVETGEFRKDLFYRISTLRIEIPPLRDRDGDSCEIAVAHGRSLGFRLTAGALRAVERYEWPGNVRQLRHCIQAAGLHANDGRIGEAAISDEIATYRGAAADGGKPSDARGLDGAWGRALRTLERLKSFGAWEFARAAELSRRSAQRHLARLLRDGRITRDGAGRTTRYSLRA